MSSRSSAARRDVVELNVNESISSTSSALCAAEPVPGEHTRSVHLNAVAGAWRAAGQSTAAGHTPRLWSGASTGVLYAHSVDLQQPPLHVHQPTRADRRLDGRSELRSRAAARARGARGGSRCSWRSSSCASPADRAAESLGSQLQLAVDEQGEHQLKLADDLAVAHRRRSCRAP